MGEGGQVPDDAQLYEDADGIYAIGAGGERWNVVDAPADDQAALEDVFINAADGDVEAAARSYQDFEERMAAAHGGDEYMTMDEAASWAAKRPVVAAAGGLGALAPYLAHTDGDIEAAAELLEHKADLNLKAAEKLGYSPGPKVSIAEALDDAFSEGLLGAKGRQPYKHTPTGDPIGDAAGEMAELLSVKRAVGQQATDRVKRARRQR